MPNKTHKTEWRCGHTAAVPKPFSLEDAQTKVCPRCHFAPQVTEAARQAIEDDLPCLVGSEAQCAWAITIRKRLLQEARDHLLSQMLAGSKRAASSQVFAEMCSNTEATWWINRRGTKAATLLAVINWDIKKRIKNGPKSRTAPNQEWPQIKNGPQICR